MRLKGAKQVHYDSGPNMTPLVDVVMVILIFLMLAGSFGGAQHFLVSNTPITKSGAGAPPPPPGFIPDEPLEIRVDVTGDGFAARVGDRPPVSDPEELKNVLAQRLRLFKEQADIPPERIQVIIMPGRNVDYQHFAAVYEAALRAGFIKVGYSTSH